MLETKFQVWGGRDAGTGLALRAAVKFPIADDRDLHSTGNFDFAGGVAWSWASTWGTLHLNANYSQIDSESPFRPEAGVKLNSVVGIGGGYYFEAIEDKLAVGVQAFGYTNAYRDVRGGLEGFDGAPISAFLGARWFPSKRISLDFGVGPGISSDAASFNILLGLAYQR